MTKIHIDFIKHDKKEYIKLVQPNINNRFDEFYKEEFELIKIETQNENYYIPLRYEAYIIKLGLFAVKLPQKVFEELINFVFKMYKDIDFIEIKHSLNQHNMLKKSNLIAIELNYDNEFFNLLNEKIYSNFKQELNIEFKTFEKDIPSEVASSYFKFKKEKFNHNYKIIEQEYLKEFQITKANVLYINNKISAVSFICSTNNFKEAYLKDYSYDCNLENNNLANAILYYTIKKLTEENYEILYMPDEKHPLDNILQIKTTGAYTGIITRTKGKHILRRKLFQFKQNDTYYFLRLLGLKFEIRKKKENCPLEINQNTKCLMVCPHPDDEILGAGGLMIKYSNNFDCLCVGSSGVATPDINAKDRSRLRIKEFGEVMDTIGIKNYWIFETYGKPRFDNQMDAHFSEYCNTLKNLKEYDYIFLPHPNDGHHEHRHITNKLFKRIARKVGINPKSKIVFYEVWADIKNPNVFFDTSKNGFLYSKKGFKKYQNANSKLLGLTKETLLELKYKILSMYESQWRYNSMFSVHTTRTKCLNNDKNPIWRFKVVDINSITKSLIKMP